MIITEELGNLTNKDKVVIENTTRKIRILGSITQVQTDDSWININDIKDEIQEIEKYTPTIYFGGSNAYVQSYSLNSNNELVWIELLGQEQNVRSITALFMQGKISLGDNKVFSDEIPGLKVIAKGNVRKIQSLGNGVAHSIVYNHQSIVASNFNTLISNDDEGIYNEFLRWLKKSMKMPTLDDINKELYQLLKDEDFICENKSYNIKSFSMSEELLKDDCIKFQELVLKLLHKNNLIEKKKTSYNLPKSVYLTNEQVQDIYSVLEKMPDLYDLEDIDLKPVGLKLFSPSMTYYVVESNKGCEDFEPFERCFGYVVNSNGIAEWGYFSIPEILEVSIPIALNNQKMHVGFERDLYFNKKINNKGKLFDVD